jgi:hypothetical protein
VRIGTGAMGCSIIELCDFTSREFTDTDYSDGWMGKNVSLRPLSSAADAEKLRKHLLSKGKGGLATWADTDDRTGGAAFFKHLDELGYHVDKSIKYTNPGHSGKCTLYFWYFRNGAGSKVALKTKAKRLGLPGDGGETLAEKAKAAVTRVATKLRRAS